jgi:uncharacterized Zn-finger protein
MSLGALAIAGLSSCSLPSEQAWREIRQEGLITYFAKEGEVSAKPSATTKTQPATSVTTTTSVPQPQALASTATGSQSLPTAQAVPGLEGYVRTPFTTPSRLVDVRGMAAGSKVVCPYTRRPFLVPSTGGERQVVSTSTPAAKPTPAPVETTAPQPSKSTAPSVATTVPDAPTKVAANTTPAPQPPPAPAPQTKPNPPVQQTPPAPEAPKPAVTAELPMGVAIPGRPGFVNSPFAAKHQLVDVTGLPTGMEVKCPYTGKLFRVPPQTSNATGN